MYYIFFFCGCTDISYLLSQYLLIYYAYEVLSANILFYMNMTDEELNFTRIL